MYDEMLGQPTILSVDGTAAAEAVVLRPDEGEAYLLYDLYAYHDDNGGAKNCSMQMYYGTTSINLAYFAALADSTNKWLRIETGNNRPLWITRAAYFRWFVSGIGAGKKGYIRGYAYKFRGLPIDERA